MKKQKLGFIGAGKVGTALAARLSKGSYPVIAVANTGSPSAQKLADLVPGCQVFGSAQRVVDKAEHIFITTPDDFISKVVSGLTWHPGQNVVHCSGAASIDILEPAERSGARVGSFHPCQAFASVDQAIENLPGSTFAIEAQTPLLDILKDMASSIECDWIVLKPGNKALYHAAAVFVSNYSVALLKVATDLFQNFDVPTAQATEVLMPLIQGNFNNIRNIGLPNCLTGPIARGDVSTIQKHIYALQEKEPSLLKLYAELGLKTVPIALAKGTIDETVSETLENLLKTAIHTGKHKSSLGQE
ncbi:MAG: DUF2520 domain-containing protein [Deltaproteobacteria bacterium]|nr:DUF2520 domain-containing protein [Deltaproteobacteria bacterium]